MSVLQEVFLDLNKVLPILNHWLHLLSAIVWIGGLAFLVMAVTPGLKTSVPKEFIKPICDTFYKQYRKIVGLLLLVILFTGGINLHYVSELMILQTGEGITHNAKYLTIFFIKLALVLGIMTLYLYTVIFGIEPTGEETAEEKEEHTAEPIPFQRGALGIGVFIILCAAALKHLHF
jgi:putative copper export protein